jgi:hypothetical protein
VEELAGTKVAVTRIKAEEVQKEGEKKLERGDYAAFVDLLRVHNSADEAGNGLSEEQSANGIIGLPYEDPRESVESWLRRKEVL